MQSKIKKHFDMNLNKQMMKHANILLAVVFVLMSCGRNTGYGELTGVPDRSRTEPPMPHGMVSVPGGFFTMGAGGEDPTYSMTYTARNVSISPMYMDETEITNNKYRQFVQWVIDSIKYRLLGEVDPETFLIEDETGALPMPAINWAQARKRIRWNQDLLDAMEQLYVPADERYFHRKEIDTRKLNYEYQTFDYQAAATKSSEEPGEEAQRYAGVNMASFVNRPQSLRSRAGYIKKHVVNVYPDTLCWIVDFAYSYNDPTVRSYFSHPRFDDYPVVGVNWFQAQAFCKWRTGLHNAELESRGISGLEEYRLPTEAEWEFAARGGLELNPYPWGGPYATNMNGCLLGNFKPQRGRYALDGNVRTAICAHYAPNDYGLYDMMGNVSEWCEDAYQDSYEGLHDLDPVFKYDASGEPNDKVGMKRKVIRGGSFKDFAENCKVYARHYEYQDTCKSYIGFRCVMSAMGGARNGESVPRMSSNVYK